MKPLLAFLLLTCSVFGQNKKLAALQAEVDDLRARLNPAIISVDETDTEPPTYHAVRTNKGLVGFYSQSLDGRSWSPLPQMATPAGTTRSRVTMIWDGGKLVQVVNATDIPLTGFEPAEAMANTYLRVRTSEDGKAWTEEALDVPGVTRGLNAVYQGDVGSVPISVNGVLLVPANATVVKDGRLYSPGGDKFWFFDAVICRLKDGVWTFARIPGDETKSTRGFAEPTLAVVGDRILCLMRGSNGGLTDKKFRLRSAKWASWSDDGGVSWTSPEPWDYQDAPLFSPSSMSRLFTHSSGRVFWVGNDSDANCQGSLPRSPLVMLEVDRRTGRPLLSSRVVLADAKAANRLDLSHAWVVEDGSARIVVIYLITEFSDDQKAKSTRWGKVVLAL